MGVYNLIYSAAADTAAAGFSAVYATARASTTVTSSDTAANAAIENSFTTPNYFCSQVFHVYDTSAVPSGSGTGYFSIFITAIPTNTNSDLLRIRQVSSVNNKIAGASLSALTLVSDPGTFPVSAGRYTAAISDVSTIPRSSTFSVVWHTVGEENGTTPTGGNTASTYLSEQVGTTSDPFLQIYLGSPWVFVGVSNEVAVATTAHALVTTGISGTLAAGDLLVACITSRIASTTSVTLPTGGEWTLVAEQKNNNVLTTTSAAASGLMAYCVRGASNPNLTFTHPVAPSQAQGRIVAYRNVNTSSPKDTQTSFTTASTTAVSGTGLTTTQIEDLIVAMAAGGQEATWSAFNATDPAGASGATVTTAPTTTWSERADSLVTTGADGSLAIFDAVKLTSGATGNLTATASLAALHVVIAGAFKIAVAATFADGVGDADGTGTVSATGAATAAANASTASGTGTASATGTGIKSADASTAAGVGTAAATGSSITIVEGAGDADGVGAASGVGTGIKSANASTAAGIGAASATGVALAIAAGTAAGVGAASATGTGIAVSVGSASGIGTATAEGATAGVTSSAQGTAAGVGTAMATGTATAASVGTAAGIGAAAGAGHTVRVGAGDADGIGTAAATGALTGASVGTAAGIGTATAEGGGTGSGVGDADGIGAATATSRSTAASAGDADGIGTAAATATATAASVGTAEGDGTALALSDPGTTTGEATGQGTAAATGRAITIAIGVASGVGSASAIGAVIAAGAGTARGIGTAAAVSGEEAGVIAEGVGNAAGIGSAHAVGRRIRERPSGGLGLLFRPGPAVIEGVGYGVLPELEGYAVGTAGRRKTIAGRAKGVVALTGHCVCDVGVKGAAYSIARLPLMASASMDAGSAGRAEISLKTCTGVSMGDHDPDEHVVIALMMAA